MLPDGTAKPVHMVNYFDPVHMGYHNGRPSDPFQSGELVHQMHPAEPQAFYRNE